MIEASSVPPRKYSENIRKRSSSLRNNFGESSEIFRKWSEHVYNKTFSALLQFEEECLAVESSWLYDNVQIRCVLLLTKSSLSTLALDPSYISIASRQNSCVIHAANVDFLIQERYGHTSIRCRS